MKHAAPALGAPARTHQGAWRAAACWAVALAAALAGCLRGLLAGADLQIEQLGLLALLAPLLAAPVGARQGWVTAPGWPAYACALVAVAAFWLRGPEGAWATLAVGADAWWVHSLEAGGRAPRGARAVALGLLALGLAAVAARVVADPAGGGLRLGLVAIAAWEALRGARSPGAELRRALVGWALAASALAPAVRGAAASPDELLAVFALAYAALRALRTAAPALGLARVGWTCVEYACWIVLPLCSVGLAVGDPNPTCAPPTPDMTGDLRSRLAYYAEHKDEFDVVFLGDSRTLCGIHPEFVDPLLDRRSINLAASAHWIPAQYPFVRDLVEELRPGTAVVLSVGPINFIQLGEGALGTTYPIPLDELGLYLSLGFSLQQLRPNLIEHSVLGSPVRPLLAATAQVRQVFDGFGQRALYPPATEPPPDPYLAQAERLGAQLRADPEHVFVGPVYGDGHVTSLEVYGARGGYQRIELDRAFFRARQVAPLEERPFVLSEARLALFERILALCRERGVHLIVNEICEAPHTYVGEREQRELAFMRDVVRPLVASYGFPCTRPDYTQLDDADYLDYNHFNQDGVQRYAPLLAEVLRPHLPPRKD